MASGGGDAVAAGRGSRPVQQSGGFKHRAQLVLARELCIGRDGSRDECLGSRIEGAEFAVSLPRGAAFYHGHSPVTA